MCKFKEQSHVLLRRVRDSMRHHLPRARDACFASNRGELSRAERVLLVALLGVLAFGQAVVLVAGGDVLRAAIGG